MSWTAILETAEIRHLLNFATSSALIGLKGCYGLPVRRKMRPLENLTASNIDTLVPCLGVRQHGFQKRELEPRRGRSISIEANLLSVLWDVRCMCTLKDTRWLKFLEPGVTLL